MSKTTEEITAEVRHAGRWIAPLQTEVARVVVGQKYLVEGQLHGRTKQQHYYHVADWNYIEQCTRAVAPLPLFGAYPIALPAP